MDNEDLGVRYVAEDGIALAELNQIATQQFGDLVKAVVDISEQTMAIGAELHSDEEAYLLARGSKQQDLWGINLYPDQYGSPQWLEFDSMINVRPFRKPLPVRG